jgi:hypothetical protein
MITCHKEMSCHGHVTFATPTLAHIRPSFDTGETCRDAYNLSLKRAAKED